MLNKKTYTSNSCLALPRLHAAAVDFAHELINGGVWNKRVGCQNSPKLTNGNKAGEHYKKRNN